MFIVHEYIKRVKRFKKKKFERTHAEWFVPYQNKSSIGMV